MRTILWGAGRLPGWVLALGLAILFCSPARAQLARIVEGLIAGFDKDDPLDAYVTFDFGSASGSGVAGPKFTVTTTDMGVVEVETGALFVGQSHVLVEEEIGGEIFKQYAMVDDGPSSPLTFSTDLPGFIFDDAAAAPYSPVLASTFLSSVALKFSSPVAFVGFRAGYFDDIGSIKLTAFDADGLALGTTTSMEEGFEFFGLANPGGVSNIHGISLYHPASFPGVDKFGLDNLIFGSADRLTVLAELAVSTDSDSPVGAPGSTTLLFPAARVGDFAIGYVTMENSGGLGPLGVTAGTPTGADADQFLGGGHLHLVAAGTSSPELYKFSPTTPGTKTAFATVASYAGDVTVKLTGSADTPVFGLDGTAYDAGAPTGVATTIVGPLQELPQIDYGKGEVSSMRTFMIDNASLSADLAGITSLNIASVSVVDPDGRFSLADADEVAALLATTLEPSTDPLPVTVLFDGLPRVALSFDDDPTIFSGAYLEFVTDVNGPVDSELTTFRFPLTSSIVRTPEPASALLWLLAAMAIFFVARRSSVEFIGRIFSPRRAIKRHLAQPCGKLLRRKRFRKITTAPSCATLRNGRPGCRAPKRLTRTRLAVAVLRNMLMSKELRHPQDRQRPATRWRFIPRKWREAGETWRPARDRAKLLRARRR